MAITVPVTGTDLSVAAFGAPVANQLNALAPTTWVAATLINGCANVGGVQQIARYRKIGDMIYLEGMVISYSLSLPSLNLPAGFRPPKQIQRPFYNGNTVGAGAITTGGDLYIQFGAGSLDIGCSFAII